MSKSSSLAYKIVLAVLVCGLLTFRSDADDSSSNILDNHTRLLQNMTPTGPPASEFSAKVNQLIRDITPKEKIGQMTRLELSMVTDGMDQNVHIDSRKLHQAIVDHVSGRS